MKNEPFRSNKRLFPNLQKRTLDRDENSLFLQARKALGYLNNAAWGDASEIVIKNMDLTQNSTELECVANLLNFSYNMKYPISPQERTEKRIGFYVIDGQLTFRKRGGDKLLETINATHEKLLTAHEAVISGWKPAGHVFEEEKLYAFSGEPMTREVVEDTRGALRFLYASIAEFHGIERELKLIVPHAKDNLYLTEPDVDRLHNLEGDAVRDLKQPSRRPGR